MVIIWSTVHIMSSWQKFARLQQQLHSVHVVHGLALINNSLLYLLYIMSLVLSCVLSTHNKQILYCTVLYCIGSHFLRHLLPPYRTSDLRGHPFQLSDYYTDLHKILFIVKFILNKIVYWYLVVLLFVFITFKFFIFYIAIVFMCVWMCVCRNLINITY